MLWSTDARGAPWGLRSISSEWHIGQVMWRLQVLSEGLTSPPGGQSPEPLPGTRKQRPGLPGIPGFGRKHAGHQGSGTHAFQMKTLPLAKWMVCRAK